MSLAALVGSRTSLVHCESVAVPNDWILAGPVERVLISDLLWPGEPLQILRRLRDGAAALFVIQLLAREDANPPEHGNLRVVDSETGEENEIYIDSSVARQYAQNLAQLQQSWADACRQCGAHMTTLIAEDLAGSLSELESIQLLTPA